MKSGQKKYTEEELIEKIVQNIIPESWIRRKEEWEELESL